ncbi:endonuclease domain-containing protein [Labilibaculum manganireducens]|uniref:endonuclease domain-containing protein n=1 Tax=Labilibaculum manganireducens TaxID=1940525 RepID=UPI0029F54A1B|nr:endonuclease domain-containing protein [Labilibaculum manganireducens]
MVDYKECLFYDASPEIHSRAKELRRNMTESEKLLWTEIRNRKLNGLKFRRQHPINIFIADFYCHEIKLVIELDGNIHDYEENKEYDEGRTAELEYLGVKVIRFTNEEVMNSMNKVLAQIKVFCKQISF